jgi:ribosomal protein L44E
MGAAAAQEGAKWERRQPKREQNGSGGSTRGSKMGAAAAQEGAKWERRQRKREQIGSGGSPRGSKMGAAAAQEGAKWERRQRKREQNGSGGSARGSKLGAAAAQEGAKEVAAAGAAWGAEASGLLGFWIWGRCFLRFSTAAGLSMVVRCIGSWFCCTIYIWHSCVLVTCWL